MEEHKEKAVNATRFKVLAVKSKCLDIHKASRMDFKNSSKYEKEKAERISQYNTIYGNKKTHAHKTLLIIEDQQQIK